MTRPAIIIPSAVAIICTGAIIASNHRTAEAVNASASKAEQRAIADRAVAAHAKRGKELGELNVKIAEAFVHLRELIDSQAREVDITIAKDHLADLDELLDHGAGELVSRDVRHFHVAVVAFPAVPKQRCRLRMSLMSGHSRQDLDCVLETLQRLGVETTLLVDADATTRADGRPMGRTRRKMSMLMRS